MRHYELDSTETVIAEWGAGGVGYAVTKRTKVEVRFKVNEALETLDWRISVFDEEKQTPPDDDD